MASNDNSKISQSALAALQRYCQQNNYIRCEKLSQSGYAWNQRILFVNSQYIAYYNVTKSFDENKFKQKVLLSNLTQLSHPTSEISLQRAKNCITIVFQTKYCQNYKSKRNSNESENDQDIGHTLWIFKFDPKKYDIFTEQIPNQFQNSEQNEGQQQYQQQQKLNANQDSSLIMQNNQNIQQQYQMQQSRYGQQQNASVVASRYKQSPQRQQANLQNDKESKKKRMRIKWDYRYNNLWEEYYSVFMENKNKSNYNFDLDFENKFGLKLFAFIGEFRKQAVENVRNIIHELIFPVKLRRYLEVKNNHPMYQFKNRNERAYLVDGIFIRVAQIEIFSKESLQLKKRSDSSQKNQMKDIISDTQENKQVSSQQTEIYRNLETKMIAHEFRSNDIIADAIHQFIMSSIESFEKTKDNQEIKEKDLFSLRIPLTCQIDYLGFTCLCSTVAPLLLPLKKKQIRQQNEDDLENLIRSEKNANNLSLIHGLTRNGVYLEYESQKLIDDLELLGDCLKLKPFQINGIRDKISKQINVYISLLTEVHCLKNKDLIQSDIKNEVEGETRDKKLKRLKILHSKQKKSDKSDIQEHNKFYLMKTATTFPLQVDVDGDKQKMDLFKNRLRPEFLSMIQCSLSNGAFLNSNNSVNTDQDDLLLASACLKLMSDGIKNLVEDLQNMVIQPIGTEQLSYYFHFYGVNMRHLGKVASRSNLPHIKEICITDMIARSSKKILRANLAKLIVNHYSQSQGYSTYEISQKIENLLKRDDTVKEYSEYDYEREFITVQDNIDYNKGKTSSIDKRISDGDKKPAGKNGIVQRENSEDEHINLSDQKKQDDDQIYEEEHEFQQRFDENIQSIKNEMAYKFQEVLKEAHLECLNLMFTKDQQSIDFWNEILIPQIQQDFDYTITYEQASSLSHGYLLHAISYHWRLSFNKKYEIKIFDKIQPSDHNNFIDIHVHSKVYQFRTLKINQITKDYNKCINLGQYDEAITYMKIKKKNYQLTYDKILTAPAPHLENDLTVEIVDANLMKLDAKNKELQNQKTKKGNRYRSYSKRQSPPSSPSIQSQGTNPFQREMDEEKLLQEMIKDIKNVLATLPLKHAYSIKPMRTLIKIYTYINSNTKNTNLKEQNIKDCMDLQNYMLEYIKYHLGDHHPLNADLCAIQSDYNFLVQENEKALQSLSDAIKICKTILGGNHVKMSDLYQKQAIIFLNQKQNQKALQFFQLSKSIIENKFGPESINYGKICYEISKIYFSTSDLQQGIQLCKQAYQIFYQHGEDYIMQSLNCCRQCCEAALNLRQPKEVIEYAEKTWDILKQFDKKLKKSQRISYLEFIFEALLRIVIYSLRPEERNYLFCILLYCSTEKNPFRHIVNVQENKSKNENSVQNSSVERQPSNIDSSISQIGSPDSRMRGKTSFDLNLEEYEQNYEDNTLNIFEDYRQRVKKLKIQDLNQDQLERASLYPDYRIFNPQQIFEQFDQQNQVDVENKKKDLFEQLTKDISVSALDIIKNMFIDILSKKYIIPLKDFFINFKKYLAKNNDYEKLEQLDLYKTFIEIYGYVFFYKQLNNAEFSKYKILDYDPK
ncbi:translation initiation factor eIF3 subunit (macronuclear) [Tetrahymena thermophila SB210]|uniref:Translation initiation factor eIF3 subunit n=1 Tax=Tetrahymena thermophila (strain SB210) TaxID=312017 RepID=I7M2X7_TETTS|nr:translation initiation factor eIF3 subunit [Tetrahymena thermophila SB210]EAS01492.3 translation initiation factor eIF3 subunit [Tetrahymena thermophila SB210]|eukprot:XP_001021738.3 translation initiation factor eIF3 subunit [Tetrahymena thermophila SB210]